MFKYLKKLFVKEENRPKRVALIGSSRFKETFQRVGHDLEISGCLVLCMSFFQHSDNIAVSDEDRRILEWVDKHRIDLADEVFVVNKELSCCIGCGKPSELIFSECCGQNSVKKPYIGESTQKEIDYATYKNKPVGYLYH
jgi:hypothetical protein